MRSSIKLFSQAPRPFPVGRDMSRESRPPLRRDTKGKVVTCRFVGFLAYLSGLSVRGTGIALGAFNMNSTGNILDFETAPGLAATASTPTTTPTDWVEEHGDYLFNFAVGQVLDGGVAEDLVQETFLAAMKSRDRFGGRCSERTWLTGILRHKIYDHLRYVCRERSVRADNSTTWKDGQGRDESTLWLHDVADECASPSHRMELTEFRANLESALGKLPPRVAQVFQLYEVEERPNREVCERLQISESNLWVMLHRARKQLREHLDSWWQ
jgi:RNA polymerase sigma-70 factor (ECF subfamily)